MGEKHQRLGRIGRAAGIVAAFYRSRLRFMKAGCLSAFTANKAKTIIISVSPRIYRYARDTLCSRYINSRLRRKFALLTKGGHFENST